MVANVFLGHRGVRMGERGDATIALTVAAGLKAENCGGTVNVCIVNLWCTLKNRVLQQSFDAELATKLRCKHACTWPSFDLLTVVGTLLLSLASEHARHKKRTKKKVAYGPRSHRTRPHDNNPSSTHQQRHIHSRQNRSIYYTRTRTPKLFFIKYLTWPHPHIPQITSPMPFL